MKELWRRLLAILLNQMGWATEMAVTGITEIDDAIPEFWGDGIELDSNRESFWGQLSGKEGSRMPVIDKTGPLKNKGDLLRFNTISQLMGTGVTGEGVLKGNEELLSVGVFTVSADVVRHAVAVSRKSTKQANFDEVARARELLKEWMTRKKDNDVFTTIIDNASDTLYAASNTSEAVLNEDDGDVFGMAEIDMIRLALMRQGAEPIQVKKQNGRTVPVYGIVFGEVEEYRLYQNTVFAQVIKDAWERFKGNNNHPLFSGVIGMYKNMLLYPYYSVLPIPQGTPLRPETTVYVSLITLATTLTVGGGTEASGVTPNYTQFFASTGSIQVEDEVIGYTGKSVNTFTGLTRGANEHDDTAGAATTAAYHNIGKLVTQRNIATVIGFGAEAVFRAIGDTPEPIGQKDDYSEQIGLGIRSYHGQALKKDSRRNKTKNVVIMKVYSENPGTI